jgi:hypothetical protein
VNGLKGKALLLLYYFLGLSYLLYNTISLMKEIIFKLVSIDKPVIKNNIVIKENKIGGIKYIYDVMVKDTKTITIFKREFSLYKRIIENKTRKIFFRPLKKYWGKSRNRLPYHYWGKKTNPLTNFVILLKKDFTDIKKVNGIISIENSYIDNRLASMIRREIPLIKMEYKSNLF